MELSYEVTDPATAALDPGAVAKLIERAHREVDSGLLPSCQLALARDGRLVATATIGDATDDTRYVIFSCTKALVASGVWLLLGDGSLDLDTRVADLLDGFGSNGKDVITLEQVMLHTCGFPTAPMPPAAWADRAARLDRYRQWRLNWEPGTRFEYHPTAAHWVLADLIEAVAGVDYRAFLRDRVLAPLGLAGPVVGVPEADQEGIATLVSVGDPMPAEQVRALFGVDELPLGEVTAEFLLGLNQPAQRADGLPGGGGVARAADLALLYQGFLHNPGGLWDPAVLADATGKVRCTYPDPMVGVPCNRTIGLAVAGDDGQAFMRHNFGRTVSPAAFGHAGAGGQIAWADPATGLSFAYLTNGLDQNPLNEGRRDLALSSLAAVCANP